MGSAQTAMDLERVRKLLGEPTLNVIGMSHGSQVAVLYATLFPERVRAMVLDGYSDLNLSPGARELSQAAAFEHALNELLADCAADRACPLQRNGDPGRALDQLLMRLDASPIESDTRIGKAATQSDAFEAIVGALMRDETARKRLLEALAEAVDENGGPLSRIADGIRADYISSGLSLGNFMAISCADTASWWAERTPDEVEDLAARVGDAAPRLGRWLWSPPASAALPPVGLCAMQTPSGAARLGRVNTAATGPILVLATSGDPSTPIGAARRAMHAMDGAVMVELERDHHLSYPWAVHDPTGPDYRCVLASVEVYLIELKLPASDHTCSQ
jgi:pimeloyl-ACP methyl ester carboxylesterase